MGSRRDREWGRGDGGERNGESGITWKGLGFMAQVGDKDAPVNEPEE